MKYKWGEFKPKTNTLRIAYRNTLYRARHLCSKVADGNLLSMWITSKLMTWKYRMFLGGTLAFYESKHHRFKIYISRFIPFVRFSLKVTHSSAAHRIKKLAITNNLNIDSKLAAIMRLLSCKWWAPRLGYFKLNRELSILQLKVQLETNVLRLNMIC